MHTPTTLARKGGKWKTTQWCLDGSRPCCRPQPAGLSHVCLQWLPPPTAALAAAAAAAALPAERRATDFAAAVALARAAALEGAGDGSPWATRTTS